MGMCRCVQHLVKWVQLRGTEYAWFAYEGWTILDSLWKRQETRSSLSANKELGV